MIPWWVAVLCFLIGGFIGMWFVALLMVNERDDRP